MKLLSLLLLLIGGVGVLFAPSSANGMCYYNRNSDCEYIVRWRPSAIFAGDQKWKVAKGDRKCSADNDGKINLNRGVVARTEVGLSIVFLPGPSGSPKIFPECTSNAEIEDHGWASLYTTSEYDSEAGCGCGLAGADFENACESDEKTLDQPNNHGFECLILNDDGKKIYP
jgi:hypothetical protein